MGEREEGRQQKKNMDGLRGSAGPTPGGRWGPWQRTANDTLNGVGERSWGVQGWEGGGRSTPAWVSMNNGGGTLAEV